VSFRAYRVAEALVLVQPSELAAPVNVLGRRGVITQAAVLDEISRLRENAGTAR